MMSEDTLREYVDRLGWEVEPHGPRTFRAVHRTREGKVKVYLRLSDSWLLASVVPFLSTKGDISLDLSRWLLRQNRDMYQAKFAYDAAGDVVLSVELPTESIDESEVREALESLIRYTIAHRNTLRNAAQQAREIQA